MSNDEAAQLTSLHSIDKACLLDARRSRVVMMFLQCSGIQSSFIGKPWLPLLTLIRQGRKLHRDGN